ncbi:DUF6531 domain-containing protein [Pseudomonas paralcaligenes]|uniref:DUF6531 domain-containing protein n=1 Tax=Pseudomonas paralcaligenes TaxID=2772558 RepID=UPI001C807C5A
MVPHIPQYPRWARVCLVLGGSAEERIDYIIEVSCPNQSKPSKASTFLICNKDLSCPANHKLEHVEYTEVLQKPSGQQYILLSEGCQNPTKGTITSKAIASPCDQHRNPQIGNPCNPANGNKNETERDFSDLGPRTGLDFTRSSNSLHVSQHESSLGIGWTHSYSARLIAASTNNLYGISWASGQFETFRFLQPGVYVSDWGTGRQARRTGSNWFVTHPDGVTDSFGSDGRWLRRESATGETVSLTYDPAGHLQQVTGPWA